jgi:hypothetical protein
MNKGVFFNIKVKKNSEVLYASIIFLKIILKFYFTTNPKRGRRLITYFLSKLRVPFSITITNILYMNILNLVGSH